MIRIKSIFGGTLLFLWFISFLWGIQMLIDGEESIGSIIYVLVVTFCFLGIPGVVSISQALELKRARAASILASSNNAATDSYTSVNHSTTPPADPISVDCQGCGSMNSVIPGKSVTCEYCGGTVSAPRSSG